MAQTKEKGCLEEAAEKEEGQGLLVSLALYSSLGLTLFSLSRTISLPLLTSRAKSHAGTRMHACTPETTSWG